MDIMPREYIVNRMSRFFVKDNTQIPQPKSNGIWPHSSKTAVTLSPPTDGQLSEAHLDVIVVTADPLVDRLKNIINSQLYVLRSTDCFRVKSVCR